MYGSHGATVKDCSSTLDQAGKDHQHCLHASADLIFRRSFQRSQSAPSLSVDLKSCHTLAQAFSQDTINAVQCSAACASTSAWIPLHENQQNPPCKQCGTLEDADALSFYRSASAMTHIGGLARCSESSTAAVACKWQELTWACSLRASQALQASLRSLSCPCPPQRLLSLSQSHT